MNTVPERKGFIAAGTRPGHGKPSEAAWPLTGHCNTNGGGLCKKSEGRVHTAPACVLYCSPVHARLVPQAFKSLGVFAAEAGCDGSSTYLSVTCEDGATRPSPAACHAKVTAWRESPTVGYKMYSTNVGDFKTYNGHSLPRSILGGAAGSGGDLPLGRGLGFPVTPGGKRGSEWVPSVRPACGGRTGVA